jgi:hypothetical protein
MYNENNKRISYLKERVVKSQKEYFDLLGMMFGINSIYNEMVKGNKDENQMASLISSCNNNINTFNDENYKHSMFIIINFWHEYIEDIKEYCLHLEGIKSVFGGDITSSFQGGGIVSSSMYLDTVMMPDPLPKTLQLFKSMDSKSSLYFFIKHSLNMMKYKDLALADVDKPIVLIIPDESIIMEFLDSEKNISSESSFYQKLDTNNISNNIKDHFTNIFNKEFRSLEELLNFILTINTEEDLLNSVNNGNRILFSNDSTKDSFSYRLGYYLENNNKLLNGRDIDGNLGYMLFELFSRRFVQLERLTTNSVNFNGFPVMDNKVPWNYLLWKLEYEAKRNVGENKINKDLVISNILSNKELPMIGNLNTESLIRLRKEGALHELRDSISKGINIINESSENDINNVAKDVFRNLNEMVENHQKDISDMKLMGKKFYGDDIHSFLAWGTLGMTAFFGHGGISLSAASLVGSAFFGTSVKDLYISKKNIKIKKEKIKKNPVGILLTNSSK